MVNWNRLEKEHPPGLTGIQPFSGLKVREIFVVCPNHKWLLSPVSPVLQGQIVRIVRSTAILCPPTLVPWRIASLAFQRLYQPQVTSWSSQ